MALNPLSPEFVYCVKSNIAYPIVGASGSALATLAEQRVKDAYTDSDGAQTQRISAITIDAAPVVNQ